jgi:hypothetical protein
MTDKLDPFVCPSCMQRFKTGKARKAHWDESKVCADYVQEGRLATIAFAHGYVRALEDWEKDRPAKKFEEGL